MKFRECTEEYIDLKKSQYYETAKDVEFVMRQDGLQDNNEGFEIAKEMILNNEGCSKKNMTLYVLFIIMVIVLGVFFAVRTSCKCFNVGNNIFDGIQAVGTITAILFTARQIRKERLMNEKEQASCISCWMSHEYLTDKPLLRNIEILNSSKQPIYNVVVSIDGIHYDDKTVDNINDKISYVQIVSPGHYYVSAQHSGGGMNMQFSASISFTDASGRHWYRDAWGKLKQKERDVFDERKISLPVEPCLIKKISD